LIRIKYLEKEGETRRPVSAATANMANWIIKWNSVIRTDSLLSLCGTDKVLPSQMI
jgi:hypothetical protein